MYHIGFYWYQENAYDKSGFVYGILSPPEDYSAYIYTIDNYYDYKLVVNHMIYDSDYIVGCV